MSAVTRAARSLSSGASKWPPPRRFALATLGVGAIAACSALFAVASQGRDEEEAPSRARALRVAIAGCLEVDTEGACSVEDGAALTVFADSATSLVFEGARVEASEAAPGGTRFSLRLDRGATHLIVRESELGGPITRVRLLPAPDPLAPAREASAVARSLRRQGDKASLTASRAMFEKAIALHRSAGDQKSECFDRLALMSTLVLDGRRFEEARSVAKGIDALVTNVPECGARRAFHLGQEARQTGHFGAALRLLDEAERGGAQLDRKDVLAAVVTERAFCLSGLGRVAEAVGALDEAIEGKDFEQWPACTRVAILQNAGYFELSKDEEGDASEDATRRAVRRMKSALDLAMELCADDRTVLVSIQTDLALARLTSGRLDEAEALLDALDAEDNQPSAELGAQRLGLRAELLLARGRVDEALSSFASLERAAIAHFLPASRWDALIGEARAHRQMGDRSAAIAAFAAASRLVDVYSLDAPLGEGRDTFFGRFESAARAEIDFLLDDDPRAAAIVARKSRARPLSTLRSAARIEAMGEPARGAWERSLSSYLEGRKALAAAAAEELPGLPSDEQARLLAKLDARAASLRASLQEALVGPLSEVSTDASQVGPLEGEVFLVFHPLPKGIAAIAWGTGGVVSARVPAVSPERLASVERGVMADKEALARDLLSPFEGAIERASRVRILAYGSLGRVDFHALPFRGAPLVASRPVAYGVDVSGRGAPIARPPPGSAALIAIDPTGDLPATRREASALGDLLRGAHSLDVTTIAGEGVTAASLIGRLAEAPPFLFHYGGHAIVEGRDGLDSSLLLSGGTRLSAADVLALRRSPHIVVLAGCETAGSPPGARAEGLGVAQAFALGGADAVIATSRPVHDDVAARVVAGIWPALGAGSGWDAALSLAEAQRAMIGKGESDEWASFRVLVP